MSLQSSSTDLAVIHLAAHPSRVTLTTGVRKASISCAPLMDSYSSFVYRFFGLQVPGPLSTAQGLMHHWWPIPIKINQFDAMFQCPWNCQQLSTTFLANAMSQPSSAPRVFGKWDLCWSVIINLKPFNRPVNDFSLCSAKNLRPARESLVVESTKNINIQGGAVCVCVYNMINL